MLKRTLYKTGSVRQFVCTVIPSNYLEVIQYENPNSTLKQSKDTSLYSCSYTNLCGKFIWSTISRYHNGFIIFLRSNQGRIQDLWLGGRE